MRVILSAFDNFEFDTRDRHFWYTLTQGFPKIYHTYGVSWIFENLPQPTPKYGGYPLIRGDQWVMGEW